MLIQSKKYGNGIMAVTLTLTINPPIQHTFWCMQCSIC